jgi:hypothetical protein
VDIALSFVIGVSLAAACGFRVFVPMLVMSVAAKGGLLELSDGWLWMASWPAIVAFSVATTAEVAGYYIPWVDNALDSLATPAAVVAGTISTAACVSHLDPLLAWSAAIIAGGGIAGTVQVVTVLVRGASTAATGGLGNFVVATGELLASLVLAVLAILAPIFALVALILAAGFMARRWGLRGGKGVGETPAETSEV